MRTTVQLDDALLDQARREAARRGETLTSLMEMGLRLVLAQKGKRHAHGRVKLPVSRAGGGVRPGVDLNANAHLLEAMEQMEQPR